MHLLRHEPNGRDWDVHVEQTCTYAPDEWDEAGDQLVAFEQQAAQLERQVIDEYRQQLLDAAERRSLAQAQAELTALEAPIAEPQLDLADEQRQAAADLSRALRRAQST